MYLCIFHRFCQKSFFEAFDVGIVSIQIQKYAESLDL